MYKLRDAMYMYNIMYFNLNSLDNKGSWRIFKDLHYSVTMLRELGLKIYKYSTYKICIIKSISCVFR